MTNTPVMRRRLQALVRQATRRVQHRAAGLVGIDESARPATVVAMLANNARRAPGYWIQLALATGIATLGLVLGSTAVVIGAMLVSPLMGPLLELGMGFAVGSALLVIHAALRVVMSILVVVAGAAMITLALPFHEVTAEVSSRIAPTALDLGVAIFCALTAAYTAVRPGADTTTAAAGTAIGIALVPPLCVTGFGIGTASGTIAGGAALLFTANLSAILLFAVIAFFLLGYNQVDAEGIERDLLPLAEHGRWPLAERGNTALRRAFASRYGPIVRIVVPMLFVAAVYVPLRHALTEVTWQVKVRDAVQRIVATEAPRAVQSTLRVERHAVELRLLIVGSPDRAAALATVLEHHIASETGVVPSVSVAAVPDAATLAALSADATASRAPEIARLFPGDVQPRISGVLANVWPSGTAGPPLAWRLELEPRATPLVTVWHNGPAIGASAALLIEREMSTQLGTTIRAVDVSLADFPHQLTRGQEVAWLSDALSLLDAAMRVDSSMACVRGPVAARRGTPTDRLIAGALQATPAATAQRVRFAAARSWDIQLVRGACADADSATHWLSAPLGTQ